AEGHADARLAHHDNVIAVKLTEDFLARMQRLLRRALICDERGERHAAGGLQEQLIDWALKDLLFDGRFEHMLTRGAGFLDADLFGTDGDQHFVGGDVSVDDRELDGIAYLHPHASCLASDDPGLDEIRLADEGGDKAGLRAVVDLTDIADLLDLAAVHH